MEAVRGWTALRGAEALGRWQLDLGQGLGAFAELGAGAIKAGLQDVTEGGSNWGSGHPTAVLLAGLGMQVSEGSLVGRLEVPYRMKVDAPSAGYLGPTLLVGLRF